MPKRSSTTGPVALILQGTLAKDDKDQTVLTPTGLVLFYVADAKTTDVFRLAPGSF